MVVVVLCYLDTVHTLAFVSIDKIHTNLKKEYDYDVFL